MKKSRLVVRIKLKEVLEERGITQKQLSDLTGIAQPSISMVCRNSKTVINLGYLAKFVEILGIKDIRNLVELKRVDNG